jgi:hypothetical protein
MRAVISSEGVIIDAPGATALLAKIDAVLEKEHGA